MDKPFVFMVPPECGADRLTAVGRFPTVSVGFAEKAVMPCRAAAFGDYTTHYAIVAATTPVPAWGLGRDLNRLTTRDGVAPCAS